MLEERIKLISDSLVRGIGRRASLRGAGGVAVPGVSALMPEPYSNSHRHV